MWFLLSKQFVGRYSFATLSPAQCLAGVPAPTGSTIANLLELNLKPRLTFVQLGRSFHWRVFCRTYMKFDDEAGACAAGAAAFN
jgi:hypothetical protein